MSEFKIEERYIVFNDGIADASFNNRADAEEFVKKQTARFYVNTIGRYVYINDRHNAKDKVCAWAAPRDGVDMLSMFEKLCEMMNVSDKMG